MADNMRDKIIDKNVFQDESRVFYHFMDNLYLHQFTTGDYMLFKRSPGPE
jgi:hypothetical protein